VANQVWRRQWVKGAPGSVPFPSQVVTALGDYVLSVNGREGTITLKPGTNVTIVETPPGSGIFVISASGGSGGGVTSVTATSPVFSSGGTTPVISFLAPGAAGNVLTSVGGAWASAALPSPPGGVFDTTAQALVQHYYVMNETTGTNITDSGTTGGATGTYAGTGVLLNQVALRNDGEGCPIFDGATGYATVPDNTTTIGFTFATMCEFNPKWDPAASLYSLWDTNANVGGSDTGFILYTSGGALTIQFGGAGTYASITVGNFLSGAQVPLGPIFFAFTHTGTVGTLYVNGFPVGSATLAYAKGGNPITIGALVGGASYNVPASFGKAIVHNAALTQAQISSLNNAQRLG